MQVFFPYGNDLNKCAQSLDDIRLNKQIVELCQILTVQFNIRYSKSTALGYANHPVVQQYNTNSGTALLLDYGSTLCEEYQLRFGKQHQGYFTLLGLRMEYYHRGLSAETSPHASPVYIKGQKDKDQIITTDHVSDLYQKLLSDKWANENPIWTNRQEPEFYHPSVS